MFLNELASAEQYFYEAEKYVGLVHFIKRHLGPMGFDYRGSFMIAGQLQAVGKIAFYKVNPPSYKAEVTAVCLSVYQWPESDMRGGSQ